MPDLKLCQNCRFFDGPDDGLKTGYCRRYAPKPHIASSATDGTAAAVLFPEVWGGDWCGEWEVRHG